MRRKSLLAAVAVVLAAAAVPATAAVGSPQRTSTADAPAVPDANQVLSGTVTSTDGEPFTDGYVLAVAEANASLAVSATPAELLAAAEADDPGVYAAQVGDDGRYSLSLPTDGTYYVVATDGVNVSAAADVAVEGETTHDPTVTTVTEADVSLAAGSAGTTTPGEAVPMIVRTSNPTPHVLGPITVTVGDLPEGWTVTGNQSTDGEWDGEESTWQWSRLPADERAAGTLTVAIPDDAELGEHEIPVTVTVGDVVVHEATWTVSVQEETTTTTPGTTTAAPGTTTAPNGTIATTTAPSGTTEADGDGGSPGFGPVAVLFALALLSLGARRR